MTEKYIKDGKVAVAYSPGYGAGWSTWESNNALKDTMVFHPDIIKMILDGKLIKNTQLKNFRLCDIIKKINGELL